MRNLSSFIIIFVFAIQVISAQPNWQWANSFGAGEQSEAEIQKIAVDNTGNYYVVGCFYGTVIMGTDYFIDEDPDGHLKGMLIKFNGEGDYLWNKQISTNGTILTEVRIDGVATNSSGDVYVTGIFCGTANITDEISITSTAPGTHSMFIVKYSGIDGTPLWAEEAAGTDKSWGYNLATDSNNNIYVTGYFKGTADFSGTPLTTLGGEDGFIAKYNPDGTFQWVNQVGDTGNDRSSSIAIDNNNNIFVIGRYNETPIFGTTTLPSGSNDMFIAKCTSSGDWQNAVSFSGSDIGFPALHDIDCDNNGNVYVAGCFNTDIDFGGGSQSYANHPGYFAKYENNLNYQWHSIMASDVDDVDNGCFALKTDDDNNVIVIGSFNGTLDFGSGISITDVQQHQAPYIAKYNNLGEIQYAQAFNNQTGGFGCRGIAIDVVGNSVFVAGDLMNPLSIGSFTVSSPDDDTYMWVASDFATLSGENDIITFVLNEQTGEADIDDINHTIDIEVISGTNVAALTPEITLSAGATANPESGITQDLTIPVPYTITAENGDEQEWTVTVNIAVGITDIEYQIAICPNPSNGIFTIQNNPQIHKVIITDITGRIIYNSKNQKSCNSIIDLSNQAKGIYFLKIKTENRIFEEKIIIH